MTPAQIIAALEEAAYAGFGPADHALAQSLVAGLEAQKR